MEQLSPQAEQAVAAVNVQNGAKYIGIGPSKMWQLIYAGDIKTFTIGRRRLIPVAELDRYIADRMAAA